MIALVKEIEQVENESDRLQVAVNHNLYEIEDQFSPLDTLCLYKVISLVGGLADAAQLLGDQLIISVSV